MVRLPAYRESIMRELGFLLDLTGSFVQYDQNDAVGA